MVVNICYPRAIMSACLLFLMLFFSHCASAADGDMESKSKNAMLTKYYSHMMSDDLSLDY